MPETLNLMHARMAVEFVSQVMIYGAENKPMDMFRRVLFDRHPPISLQEDRAFREYLKVGHFANVPDPRANIGNVLYNAENALLTQVGLCDEQADLAAGYLIMEMQQRGIGTFYFQSEGEDRRFGHVFVVLGLTTEPLREQTLSLAQYPAGWENAVWCDPWAQSWFEIKAGWPDCVKDIMRMLPNAEKAMANPIRLVCRSYFDGRVARGTLV